MTRLRGLVAALGMAGVVACSDAGASGGAGSQDGGAQDASHNVGIDAAEDAPGEAAFDATPDAAVSPITAPAEQWTWVEIPGMKCGNGQPTGVGVNLTTRSDELLLFVQGGGACWDADTCFVVQSAVNVETGYGAAQFAVDAPKLGFSRNAGSPFASATWVYVPYCTGDLHAGQRVATYATAGGPREVSHVGGLNFDALLPRLHATRPAAPEVWAIGVSAGGYGVTLNWAALRSTFAGAPVHILADCSPPVAMEATRWAAMKASWDLRQPSGCTNCDSGLDSLPAFYRSSVPATNRYGLLAYTHDATIAAYFGLTAAVLEARERGVQSGMVAGSGQAAFLVDGTTHVMFGHPDAQTAAGATFAAFFAGWITGSNGFASAGP